MLLGRLFSGSKAVALVRYDCFLNPCLLHPYLDERFVWMVCKPLVAFKSYDDCSISTDVQWLNVALVGVFLMDLLMNRNA